MNLSVYTKKIAAGICLLVLSSCTHYIYVSRSSWQDSTVVVDGRSTEWPVPLRYYDERSKIQYAISNDHENLYFCIRATEEETQTKILRAGMQVWIDTTGKNEHTTGILFPLSSALRNSEQPPRERGTGERHDVNAFRNRFLKEYKEMQLVGFKPPINGMNPINSNYGISLNINWDSVGIMTYEAMVPFKTFYKDRITVADSLKLVGVSIVVNALPAPQGGGEHSGGGGGMRSGGGMRGGGGMHGGGGHGGGGHSSGIPQGSPYLFESNTIKKIIQLTVKN